MAAITGWDRRWHLRCPYCLHKVCLFPNGKIARHHLDVNWQCPMSYAIHPEARV